ncbi:hypothetical protein SAMN04490243_2878 [Robiginitalea myxolifaciens]|uniref:Curli production assembly/transport component CsgG n=1 Tax=Robiginitalea myxolifaciens TaxID=400055 RepID=A0A1I6HLM3_9FLAO|nr:hypothetical protein [Robiginitalea myxolifaciens]SFR55352.1 hypothetical protein SAMN04490243_2878 [Robiginitalea myxolifaciens]
MIRLFFLVLFSSSVAFSQASSKYYDLDDSILNDLEINKQKDDMAQFSSDGLSYFIFFNNEIKRFTSPDFPDSPEIETLLDTTSTLMRNVCHCQLKNDTIFVRGGIFYGGGIGYEIKLTKKDFDGKIIIASNSKIYKKSDSNKYAKEIYLESMKQSLKLYEKPVFRLGSIVRGKVILTSKAYLKKSSEGSIRDQSFMKVLFECALSEYAGF